MAGSKVLVFKKYLTAPALSRLLTARHAAQWCAALLALEIAGALFVTAGSYGLLTRDPIEATTDFSSFYAAGLLADSGHPGAAYDRVTHQAVERQITFPDADYNYFYYPPTFLLICAVLARLPYLVAFFVFEIASLVLYASAAMRILARRGLGALVAVLAFPANIWTFGMGQNGFLTAGLFGWGTLLLERRPMLGGMLLGGLLVKPHFGLLVPVALVASRQWRAFAGATLSVLALSALSMLCFGWGTWQAFFASFAASPNTYQSGNIGFDLMVSVFAAARLLGCQPGAAYAIQGAVTLGCVVTTAMIWRRDLPLATRAATLLSATVLSVPLILFYDLTIVGMALAWLVRPARRPVSSGEKLLVGAVFACCFLTRSLTPFTGISLGLVAAGTTFGMAVWRAMEVGAEGDPKARRSEEQFPSPSPVLHGRGAG